MTIVESRRDEGRELRGGRDPIVQVECRIGLPGYGVHACAERLMQVEAVERHSTAPAWVERLCKENAVTCADDRLLVIRIGHAESRRKPLVPGLLWIRGAVACRSSLASGVIAGKSQTSR